MKQLTHKIDPYLQLMRWYQPTGYWLLLWPCWWSVMLASISGEHAMPEAKLLVLFLIGAIAMRSAGCIVNDMWDRRIDAQVSRTRNRPLASGRLSLWHASGLLLLLLIVALWVVIQLPVLCFWLAICALPLVVLYPLMKRITWWPQAFLGLTFNFGALMGWASVQETLEWPAWWLYAGGIFWTLGYDTIYAQQDAKDDALIGVKSTARLFGLTSKRWVAGFYLLALSCFIMACLAVQLHGVALMMAVLVGSHFGWQIWRLGRISEHSPSHSMALFQSNVWCGALICLLFYVYLLDI